MIIKHYGSPRRLAVFCMLAALGGCDQDIDRTRSGKRDLTSHARNAQAEGALCGYAYADPNFQGKQVALTSTSTCEKVPLTELFGNVGSAALSPNCTIKLFSEDNEVIHTTPSDKNAPRPTVTYEPALTGSNITSYMCQCGDENFQLVAEALESTGRDIASGENTLPLWARGLVEVGAIADGGWLNTKIAALYYPNGRGAILAGLKDEGVAFPVGAQAEEDKILNLATEYSVGIESVSEDIAGKPLEPGDYEDISQSIVFFDPYVVREVYDVSAEG